MNWGKNTAVLLAGVILLIAGTGKAAAWKTSCLTYADQYIPAYTAFPSSLRSTFNTIPKIGDVREPVSTSVNPPAWISQIATSSNGAAYDFFGIWVVMSGDTALISSSTATVQGQALAGAVYVFKLSNGVWHQTQILTSNIPTYQERFGASLAIDGTTAVIGANPYEETPPGAAYIFQESNGNWSFSQKIPASNDASSGLFGVAVALDGNYAFVSAPDTVKTGTTGPTTGTVYIYQHGTGGWQQTQELIPSTTSDVFQALGFGVSLAAQGSELLVGAPESLLWSGNPAGGVYVYNESGGSWDLAQTLAPSDPVAAEEFGIRSAINGTTAIIGAPGDDFNGINNVGAAYVFGNSGGMWSQTQELGESGGKFDDSFGCSISISGTQAAITAPYAGPADGERTRGAVYIFSDNGGTWALDNTIVGGAQNNYLYRLGISSAYSGNNALFGAPDTNVGVNALQGKVEFFNIADLQLNVAAPATVSKGASYVSQTFATNSGTAISAPVSVTIDVPVGASFMGAASTAGNCLAYKNEYVTCDFGSIPGNSGTVEADVTFKATGSPSATILNTATTTNSIPPVSANAQTDITGTNQAPVAKDGTLTVSKNSYAEGVLEATDANGDYLTYEIVSNAKHGSATIEDPRTGAYIYRPTSGYTGPDSFTFKASDQLSASNLATITVTVKSSTSGGGGSGGSGGGGANGLLGLLFLAGLLGVMRRKR